MQKVKSYQINGLQVDVLSESNKGLQTELTAIYISVNGNEPVFVGGYLYPHITKKWAKKQLADFAKAKIEYGFCRLHSPAAVKCGEVGASGKACTRVVSVTGPCWQHKKQ